MRLIIACAVLAAGLCVSSANAQSFVVTNIGSLPGNANRYYGEARGWEVAAGYDRGHFEYCYAARDRDGNGDDIRIGYGSGQWQIAVPVDSRPDWYGQLDIDGRTIGASGTAAQGWTYAWIGLPELDALRGGSHAVLRIGPYDIDFSLSGVTASTLLVAELTR